MTEHSRRNIARQHLGENEYQDRDGEYGHHPLTHSTYDEFPHLMVFSGNRSCGQCVTLADNHSGALEMQLQALQKGDTLVVNRFMP